MGKDSGAWDGGSTRSSVPPRPEIDAHLLDSACTANPSDVLLLPSSLTKTRRGQEGMEEIAWTPMCEAKAHFTRAHWLAAVQQLIYHPEQSSTDIIRADILKTKEPLEERMEGDTVHLNGSGIRILERIRRRLRPRRPNLDASMLQDCVILDKSPRTTCVLLIPRTDDDQAVACPEQVPYYHPSVHAIAFAFTEGHSSKEEYAVSTDEDRVDKHPSRLQIHVLPFEATFNAHEQPQHRLSRTVLRLVALQARLGWGHRHGYKKRVEHDTLVCREEYMDLYQEMRQKHAPGLVSKWVESTDPRKHVFEDIGIATFVMLLWRDMFAAAATAERRAGSGPMLARVPSWGRPSCFVDVGCGNGLLVHLLNAEGYTGFGVDLRARKTWKVVQESPGGADLREASIAAPALAQDGCRASEPLWPAGSFLIGNHADELTSWLPLVAAADPDCPGLVNIPCCRFALDGSSFATIKYRLAEDEADELQRLVPAKDIERTWKELQRGPPTETVSSTSRNIAYLRYVSHLHLQTGWALEKEALRIPSTKNWAIVSRRRTWAPNGDEGDEERRLQASEAVRALALREGGSWHARTTSHARPSKGH